MWNKYGAPRPKPPPKEALAGLLWTPPAPRGDPLDPPCVPIVSTRKQRRNSAARVKQAALREGRGPRALSKRWNARKRGAETSQPLSLPYGSENGYGTEFPADKDWLGRPVSPDTARQRKRVRTDASASAGPGASPLASTP